MCRDSRKTVYVWIHGNACFWIGMVLTFFYFFFFIYIFSSADKYNIIERASSLYTNIRNARGE